MSVKKYRKKPVVIEALKWDGSNLIEVRTFIDGRSPSISSNIAKEKWQDYCGIVEIEGLIIRTLEGRHVASIGDYIIKGISGEFYPCKPDIFAKTYEEVVEWSYYHDPTAAGLRPSRINEEGDN